MNKIAVLDYRILPETQEKIQELASNSIEFPTERCPEAERIVRTADADIALVTPWDIIDVEYLDACSNLKYIGLCGTSTHNIDLEELSKRGIQFSNIVWNEKKAVAEFYFMHLVSLFRGSHEYAWKSGETHELAGKTLGIIGLGHVGQAIANLALAYGMKVLYYGPNRKQDWEDRGVSYLDKSELLGRSDIIVICSPTNVEVLGANEFDEMKTGTVLVQACGGSPFDKPSFYEWMNQDGNYSIFEMSANEQNYQLYKGIPRVVFSSEVAGDTYESNSRRGERALANLKSYLAK